MASTDDNGDVPFTQEQLMQQVEKRYTAMVNRLVMENAQLWAAYENAKAVIVELEAKVEAFTE